MSKGMEIGVLPVIVMTLVIITAVAVVSTAINTGLEDAAGYTTGAVVNESLGPAVSNNTYIALNYRYAISISEVVNTTDTFTSGNYTLLANKTASSAWIHWNSTSDGVTADAYTAGAYNISYTYNKETGGYWAAKNSTLGIFEFTGNMQLLGLIIIMGAIISILLASFG